MTYEEFLDWADEDTLAEWVDGTVIVNSPASLPHQELVSFVYGMLKKYVAFRRLGRVVQAPFQMKLPHSSGREPDVLFVAEAQRNRLKRTYVDGPADLVVEVISPDSMVRDRSDKFLEYQQGGVLEYWLLDPDTQRADFYQMGAGGAYQAASPDAQGIYHSAVLHGFWLSVSWLWQDPLPDEEDVVAEIIGKAYTDDRRRRWQRRGL